MLLVFIMLGQVVFADTEGSQFPYTAETADKKYIFVILNCANPDCPNPPKDETYLQSGMYFNDGSKTPLWTVDWLAYVFLPNDGKHIVRRGRWARFSGTYEEEAFSFFAEGNLLKTYQTKDLVDFPWLLPHTVSHYTWGNTCFIPNSESDGASMKVGGDYYPTNSGVKFDNENQIVEIETSFNDKLTFDLKTGEMISATHPSRVICFTLFAGLLIGYFIYRFKTFRTFPAKSLLNFSSIIIGLTFSFSLIGLPAIAVDFAEIKGNCDDLVTLFDKLWLSFYLFPIYCTSFFNYNPQESEILLHLGESQFLSWSLSFWFPCLLIFSFLDRSIVWATSKISRRNAIVS